MLPTAISDPSKAEPGKWFSHMKYKDSTLDSNLLLNFHDNNPIGTVYGSNWIVVSTFIYVDESAGIDVPNYQDFSHIPDSTHALSLLSAQSLKASGQLLGTAMSSPSVATLSHNHHTSAQCLTENVGPTSALSSGGAVDDFKVPDDGLLFGSNSSNSKYNLSSGQGTVVDLLQLSSHLQMVEHKRNLMH